MATNTEELAVLITADIAQFTAGMAQAETSLTRVGASAEAASGVVDKANQRITDSGGRVRDGFGKFVTAAQLAADAAGNVGGSFSAAALKADGLASSINGSLTASFAAFDKKSDELGKGLGRLATGTKDAGSSLSTYLSVPLLAAGGAALKVGGDFESAFNRVQAATLSSGSELDSLRQKAQNIALDPNLKFSSVEAAQALEGLAKNGLNAAQILGGAVDATTALATATGGQLATAADITTDVMNNFGKSAEQAAGLVSNITGATIASKFSIDDYRLALGQAGAVAGQLGVNFEDFNTALSVTSSGFSSGSDAGTSFKTFLQRLVPQTKEAAGAMQKLGLNFFDAQGKMLPLRDIAGQLQQAFKGLSDQQKNTEGTKIFGSDSIRTALLLAKDGVAGFDQMAASIGKVNAASQGKILSQGFVGSFEAFKSSLEGLAQAVANSGILDFATKLSQKGAELASQLAKADPELLKLGVSIAAAAASVGPLLYGIGRLGEILVSAKAAFTAFGLTSGAALLPVLGAVAAVGAAAYLVYKKWDSISQYFSSSGEGGRLFSDLAASITTSVASIKQAVGQLAGLGQGTFGDLLTNGELVKGLFRELVVGITAFSDVVGGIIGAVSSLFKKDYVGALEEAKRATFGLIDPLANLFGFTKKNQQAFEGAAHGGGVFGDSLLHASGIMTGFNTQLQGFNGALPGDELKGLAAAADTVGLALGKTSGISEAAAKALAKLREELRLNGALSTVLGSQYDFIGERQKILEGGIKDLLKNGWSASSTAVKGYAQELTLLNDILKESKPLAPKLITPELQTLALPEMLEPDYKGIFGRAAQSIIAGGGQLQAALVPVTQAQLDFNTNMGELAEQLNTSIGPLLAGFAAQFGDAFGSVVTGAVTAGDALQSLFGGILQALGSFMSTFGQQLITIGIGKLALDTLFSGPQGGPLAIAAGAGLIALAGVVSAVGKQAAGSLKSIGSGGSLASSSSSNYANSSATNNNQKQQLTITLLTPEYRLRGGDIVAAAQSHDYRVERTR